MKNILLVSLCLPVLAFADTVTVHNTGVDSSDALVAAGAAASFWTLSSEPGGATETIGSNAFRFRNPAYFADTSTAAWVSPGADGNASAGGNYVYDLLLDLTGFDLSTVSISGFFGTDNDGAIFLNSNAAVATTGGGDFPSPTNFTINSGFVAGLNTIHLRVDNLGNPTAFFVEFTEAVGNPGTPGTGAVPEPAGLTLTCVGLLGLLALRRRVHTRA